MTLLPASHDDTLLELLAHGESMLDRGDALAAVAAFETASRIHPSDIMPPVRLAEAAIVAGAPDRAEQAALDAVRIMNTATGQPASLASAAFRVLGHARILLGKDRQGAEALTRASDLAGTSTDDWFELWRTCVAVGRLEAAAVAMREVLSLTPDHDAANADLARRQALNGDEDGAKARLRDVLRRRPDASRCRLQLAIQLLQDDMPTEALALLQTGTPAPDQRQAWLLHRIHALARLGQTDAATELLQAIGAPPPGNRLLYHHARLRLMRDADAATAMAADLDAVGEDPDERIAAHFTLSRFWDKRDEPDRAFPMMKRGHALLAAEEPFSRDDYRRFVDTTRTRLNAARLAHGPRARNASELPVFVVGMPRSGTTLMEQILAAHGSAFGAGERRALAQMFRGLGGSRDEGECVERIADLDADQLDQAAAAYLTELQSLAPDKTRIVDKMPGNFRLLGLVSMLMPGARVIHCVRDPRDIGLSIFSMRFRGHHPYSHDLADLGWYIARHDELMAHWRNTLPNPILRIHLHEWIRHFDLTLRRVLDFVGLPYDPNCERFFELDRDVRTASRHQVREAVNAKGMSRWRPYAQHLLPLIEELHRS